MELTFLGAAGTVTGSRFLLSAPTGRILIDCGMFQGPRAIRRRNWEPFPVPANSIDAVVVTHAHLDHCGYLPALVKQGFAGPIYCTHNSARLIPIILRDSAKLQEEDTAYARRSGYSRHAQPQVLYDAADAERAIDMLVGRDFTRPWQVATDLSARLDPAGHILGSATVTVTYQPASGSGATVAFSGDLGRGNHPLLKGPRRPHDADLVVMESTYGNREHADSMPRSSRWPQPSAERSSAGARGGSRLRRRPHRGPAHRAAQTDGSAPHPAGARPYRQPDGPRGVRCVPRRHRERRSGDHDGSAGRGGRLPSTSPICTRRGHRRIPRRSMHPGRRSSSRRPGWARAGA